MIALQNVAIHNGSFFMRDLNLVIPQGNYGILMGRTGAGKTTLLEAIIGLKAVSAGSIRLCGRDVTRQNPALRGIGYVPQDSALFAHMTVAEHLAFALKIRRTSKSIIAARVAEVAEMLGIAHLLQRQPAGLSGGERQRVALGRAISFRPAILCLDEPLSALVWQTCEQMCQLLATIKQATGVTTIHVTHNEGEATRLADHLFRLVDGRIES
jgi:ABC-type sugar transport system ATPase subunit